MHKQRLLRNTALLTASSLLMNAIAMSFQVWLAGRIGAAGIGLYQLVVSVMNLTATFAISGIRFAATRLVAEELGTDHTGALRSAMGRCLGYAALFGTAAALILWLLAEPIGFLWIGDARTVLSLRLAAISMPCISLCAALSGYFTACGRVWKPTLVHLAEQLCGIALVVLLLGRVRTGEVEKSCAAVTLGRAAADVVSLILMLAVYRHDRRRHYHWQESGGEHSARMLKIALPLAVSAYARSALSTVQHLLVPKGLKAAGLSANEALAGYGVIQGMALPLLCFPGCVLAALAELLIPELTRAQVRGDREEIRNTLGEMVGKSALYSVSVGMFMLFFADQLGIVVYGSTDAGRYIRLLAPLVPILYTDMTVDGCLKGLGQQVWSMGINIAESVLGLVLVWTLLPAYALRAYIGILYATELFNFLLSAWRLRRIIR